MKVRHSIIKKRVKNIEKIQEEIDQKLSRSAQLKFAESIKNIYLETAQDESLDPKERFLHVPNNFALKDAIKIYLHNMLYRFYFSFVLTITFNRTTTRSYEESNEIGKTVLSKIHQWIYHKVCLYLLFD